MISFLLLLRLLEARGFSRRLGVLFDRPRFFAFLALKPVHLHLRS